MPIKEDRYKDTEDKILSGFLLLATSFLKLDPELKKRLHEIKFENQEKHILEECYNALFFFNADEMDENVLKLPKCKKRKTRNCMFKLLHEYVIGSKENFKLLLPLLS